MAKVCKATHPTLVKFNKLRDLAYDLGLTITILSDSCTLVDQEQPGQVFRVVDVEDGPSGFGSGSHTGICSFPHETETKLVIAE